MVVRVTVKMYGFSDMRRLFKPEHENPTLTMLLQPQGRIANQSGWSGPFFKILKTSYNQHNTQ